MECPMGYGRAAGHSAAAGRPAAAHGGSREVDAIHAFARSHLTEDTNDQKAQAAVGALQRALAVDPADVSGETHRLLARAQFLLRNWEGAASAAQAVLDRVPQDPEATYVQGRANTNLKTHPEVPTASMDEFTPAQLLEDPALHLVEPEGLSPMRQPNLGDHLRNGVNVVTGKVLGTVFGTAENLAYRFAKLDENGWPTFDKINTVRGELELGGRRTWLLKHALHPSYADDRSIGFADPAWKRPEWTKRFYTATGEWTTDNAKEGAARTRFLTFGAQNRPNRAEDPSLPNPRTVDQELLAPKGPRVLAPHLNLGVFDDIQEFVDALVKHSLDPDQSYHFDVPEGDDWQKIYGLKRVSVAKTALDPLAKPGEQYALNAQPAVIMLQGLYGTTPEHQRRLRTGDDGQKLPNGKLNLNALGVVPVNPETGVADVGATANWHVDRELPNGLFALHHNYIAEVLHRAYPHLSGDELFELAKLNNAATRAKIHHNDWTQAILACKAIVRAVGTNWWGYFQMRKPRDERKAYGAWKPKDPSMGLMGGARLKISGGYQQFQSFARSMYRQLHATVPDAKEIRRIGEDGIAASIPMDEARAANARPLVEEYGVDNLVYSSLVQHLPVPSLHNYPKFFSDMSNGDRAAMSLGMHDTVRDRESGEFYNDVARKAQGLPPLTRFEQFGLSPEETARLKAVYGDDPDAINRMELNAGLLAEPKPSGGAIGVSSFDFFSLSASLRLWANPMFSEKFTPDIYTAVGIDLVERASKKEMLLLHYRKLLETGLVKVNNAYEPIDTTVVTHPEEHPLTAYEMENYGKEQTQAVRAFKYGDVWRHLDLAQPQKSGAPGYFDVNGDGKVGLGEAYKGLRDGLGLSRREALGIVAKTAVESMLATRQLQMDVEKAVTALEQSLPPIYDEQGQVSADRVEAFIRSAQDDSGRISLAALQEQSKVNAKALAPGYDLSAIAQRRSLNAQANLAYQVLFAVAGKTGPGGATTVSAEDLRDFLNGTLLYRVTQSRGMAFQEAHWAKNADTRFEVLESY